MSLGGSTPFTFTVPADPKTGTGTKDVFGVKPSTTYVVTTTGLDSSGKPVTLDSLPVECTTPGPENPTLIPKPVSPTTGTLNITKPLTGPTPNQYKVTCTEAGSSTPLVFTVPADASGTAIKDPVEGLKPATKYVVKTIGQDSSGKDITAESVEVACKTPDGIDRPVVVPKPTGPTTATFNITRPPTGTKPTSYSITYRPKDDSSPPVNTTTLADKDGNGVKDVTNLTPSKPYLVKVIGRGSDGKDITNESLEAEFSTPSPDRPTILPKATSPTTGTFEITKPVSGTTPSKYRVTYQPKDGSKPAIVLTVDADKQGKATVPVTDLTTATTYKTRATGLSPSGKDLTLESVENEFTTPGDGLPILYPKPTGPNTGTLTITPPTSGPIPVSYKVTCIEVGGNTPFTFTVDADGAGNGSKDVTGLKGGTSYIVKAIGLDKDGNEVTLESLEVTCSTTAAQAPPPPTPATPESGPAPEPPAAKKMDPNAPPLSAFVTNYPLTGDTGAVLGYPDDYDYPSNVPNPKKAFDDGFGDPVGCISKNEVPDEADNSGNNPFFALQIIPSLPKYSKPSFEGTFAAQQQYVKALFMKCQVLGISNTALKIFNVDNSALGAGVHTRMWFTSKTACQKFRDAADSDAKLQSFISNTDFGAAKLRMITMNKCHKWKLRDGYYVQGDFTCPSITPPVIPTVTLPSSDTPCTDWEQEADPGGPGQPMNAIQLILSMSGWNKPDFIADTTAQTRYKQAWEAWFTSQNVKGVTLEIKAIDNAAAGVGVHNRFYFSNSNDCTNFAMKLRNYPSEQDQDDVFLATKVFFDPYFGSITRRSAMRACKKWKYPTQPAYFVATPPHKSQVYLST